MFPHEIFAASSSVQSQFENVLLTNVRFSYLGLGSNIIGLAATASLRNSVEGCYSRPSHGHSTPAHGVAASS